MYFLKPIEQGLDVKFTGGIHRGCLRVQAATNGNINSVEDLARQTDRRPGMGTPPFIFANRVLSRMASIRLRKSPGLFFRPATWTRAAKRGSGRGGRFRADRHTAEARRQGRKLSPTRRRTMPYRDEYCCAVMVNGKFLANNPKAAAAATRALLKAAKWVQPIPPPPRGCRSRKSIWHRTPN